VRLALIALGWVVVFGALCRAGHLAVKRLWVRMAMVVSWAILAGGASLLQMVGDDDGSARVVLGVGIILAAASFAAATLTHGTSD
jgi:hypothetical protein